MVLMCFLTLLAVHHLSVCSRADPVANALSGFQFKRFRCLAPQADLAVTPAPLDLLKVT